jgi:hypothetical protein
VLSDVCSPPHVLVTTIRATTTSPRKSATLFMMFSSRPSRPLNAARERIDAPPLRSHTIPVRASLRMLASSVRPPERQWPLGQGQRTGNGRRPSLRFPLRGRQCSSQPTRRAACSAARPPRALGPPATPIRRQHIHRRPQTRRPVLDSRQQLTIHDPAADPQSMSMTPATSRPETSSPVEPTAAVPAGQDPAVPVSASECRVRNHSPPAPRNAGCRAIATRTGDRRGRWHW